MQGVAGQGAYKLGVREFNLNNLLVLPPSRLLADAKYLPHHHDRVLPRRGMDCAMRAAGLEPKFRLDAR